MEQNRPQQTASHPQQQPLQKHPLPAAPGMTHLYRDSVVGLTDERMRQLAEHFSP